MSVGTSIFHDPAAPLRVQRELAEVAARGFDRLRDAVGYAHRGLPHLAPEPTDAAH